MNVSTKQIDEILKTLPLGYYLKHDIPVELSENAKTSYYDPMNEKICISTNNINSYLAHFVSNNWDEVEDGIRDILYHEISHVILTNKKLSHSDIYNIFEDERIETVLENYYHRVNFKKFCKIANNYKPGEEARTPLEYFYKVVRFREGKKELVNEVDRIIKKYADMTSTAKEYLVRAYESEIENLYDKCREEFKNQRSNNPSSTLEKNPNGDINSSKENKCTSQNEFEEIELNEEGEKGFRLSPEELEKLTELVSSSIESLINQENYKNRNIEESIKQILFRNTGRMRQAGGAINTYSGRLDPRSVQRNDYKWWLRAHESGSIRRFDKIKLNLFIDCSTSFHLSEHKINELIHSLIELEKINKSFSFDVVAVNHLLELKNKANRKVICRGGNRLPVNIYDIYNKIQDKNSTCYNIVVFDGDAVYNASGEKQNHAKNFAVWNNKSCTIISDSENEWILKQYNQESHNIITKNYVDELESNILKALDYLIR